MGRIGTFKQLKAVDVDGEKANEATVDFGADDVVTAAVYAPAGVSCNPVNGDLVVTTELEGSDEHAVVGVIDVTFTDPSATGAIYLRARDADGAEIAHLWIKADGAFEVVNDAGNFGLSALGVFSANGHLTVAKPTA